MCINYEPSKVATRAHVATAKFKVCVTLKCDLHAIMPLSNMRKRVALIYIFKKKMFSIIILGLGSPCQLDFCPIF